MGDSVCPFSPGAGRLCLPLLVAAFGLLPSFSVLLPFERQCRASPRDCLRGGANSFSFKVLHSCHNLRRLPVVLLHRQLAAPSSAPLFRHEAMHMCRRCLCSSLPPPPILSGATAWDTAGREAIGVVRLAMPR